MLLDRYVRRVGTWGKEQQWGWREVGDRCKEWSFGDRRGRWELSGYADFQNTIVTIKPRIHTQGSGCWRTGRVAKAVLSPAVILVPIISSKSTIPAPAWPVSRQMPKVCCVFPWKDAQHLKLCFPEMELNFLPTPSHSPSPISSIPGSFFPSSSLSSRLCFNQWLSLFLLTLKIHPLLCLLCTHGGLVQVPVSSHLEDYKIIFLDLPLAFSMFT